MLANTERLREMMRQFRLDVLIASHPENVTYLTDFESNHPYMYRFLDWESYGFLAAESGASPALIIPTADAAWPARFPTWAEDIYTFGPAFYILDPEGELSQGEAKYREILDQREKNAPTAGEAIVKALKGRGFDRARIGLDEKNIYPRTLERLRSDLPHAEIVNAFELFRIARMLKTPDEIERLRTVGLKNERAAMALLEGVRAGVSEEELTQLCLESIAKEGAVFEFCNTASGTQSSMPILSYGYYHSPSGYRLKQGDLFKYDCGCIFDKYHADIGGCAVIGPPTKKQTACYSAIEAGTEKALELLRPGALPSQIFQETVATVEKAGLKDYSKRAGFCGHGIGLEARDYPVLRQPVKSTSPFLPGSYDIPIEENMVINVEVPYSALGLGGLQIEYTLLVTKNGCEKLYPQHRELLVR
jgi:Xaa-Pro dipeptidase